MTLGALTGTGLLGDAPARAVWRSETGDVRAVRELSPGGDGRFELAPFPAGTIEVLRATGPGGTWERVATGVVPPGGTGRIDL